MADLTRILHWIKTSKDDPKEGERVIAFSSRSKNPRVKMQIIDWWKDDYVDFDYYMLLPKPPTD